MNALTSPNRQSIQTIGVIDTLSAGYNLVNRRLWLILVPVFLDLLLWLGPHLSVAPLIIDIINLAPPAEMRPDQVEALEQARQTMLQMAQEFNLLGLLVAGFLGVPGLIGVTSLGASFVSKAVFPLYDWWAVLLLVIVLVIASIWLGAIYLVPLAQIVREGGNGDTGDRPLLLAAARQYWLTGWRLSLYFVLLLAVMVSLGMPLSLIISIIMVFNPNLAAFFGGLLWIAALWVAFYLFFTIQSITVGQTGVLRSLWNSLNVVRWNLGSALGLVLLVNLVQRGMPIVWRWLAQEPWGVPIGIVGNAYIGTGLMASTMIFYRYRFALWQDKQAGAGKAPDSGR